MMQTARTLTVRLIVLALIFGLVLSPLFSSHTAQASADVLKVTPNGAAEPGCGATWAGGCDLQYALANAPASTELWVKEGTYYPTTTTDRLIAFVLTNNVALYGGFSGDENSRDARHADRFATTVLSGDIGVRGTIEDNSTHVVASKTNDPTNSSILDGFLITGGRAYIPIPTPLPQAYYQSGAGVKWSSGKLALSNATIQQNSARSTGAGISLDNAEMELNNVIIRENAVGNIEVYYNEGGFGGGMYINNASPVMTGVTFEHNTATYGGGGLNSTQSSPLLQNVYFINNAAYNPSSASAGGGMHNVGGRPALNNVLFSGNSAASGAGLSNQSSAMELTQVTFSRNVASNEGGGLRNTESTRGDSPMVLTNVVFQENSAKKGGGMVSGGSPSLTHVAFIKNSASDFGGGYYDDYGGYNVVYGPPKLTDVLFDQNSAVNYGGGFYTQHGSPVITNATFSHNTAGVSGGGIYSTLSGDPLLTNVTFAQNQAGTQGGGAFYNDSSLGAVHNAIFWNNSPDQVHNASAALTITNSVVQGGYAGQGNISADPLLAPLGLYGGSEASFALLPGSPAIDRLDAALCPDQDQRGVTRPQGSRCDLGAYEARPFTLTILTGGEQIAKPTQAFHVPLKVRVSSSYGEPVEGGYVIFTAPGGGASAVLSTHSAKITSGVAQTTAQANEVEGEYRVTASAAPALPVEFRLINLEAIYSLFLPVAALK